LSLQLIDLLTEPGFVARFEADEIRAGDVALDRAVVTAEGSPESFDIVLDLTGDMLAANARGQVALTSGETRIEASALTARYAGTETALAGPARITLARDLLLVDGLVLRAEGGRLSVAGRYGGVSDLVVTLSGVPLELMRLAAPDLELSGRLDGGARLTGTRAAPRASGDFTATGVTLTAVREAGIAGVDVTGKIDWDAVALSLESSVNGEFGGSLTASARLSAPSDPAIGLPTLDAGSSLTGRVSGSARLGVLNDLLAARGDRVEGNLAIDLTVAGSLADPRIEGMLALTEGSYRGPLTGISLDDIRVRLNGDGDRLTITEFSARAPNGGNVRARGGIDVEAGFPADITFAFIDALVIDNDVVSAEVAGNVAVTGELTRALNLAGRLKVVEAEIRLPERLPPSIQTLEVEEINVPPELLAQRPTPRSTAAGIGTPLPVALDFTIDSPGRIFVRGRGLDAEVAGEVTVRGTADAPDMAGGFQLRRGHLDAIGRRFIFDEGVVTLPGDGSVDADIRFVARARAGDVSAQITVSGRASAPKIHLESVPDLPQDEILARILFGKRSSALSEFESIHLARSALQLTGIGSGPDVLGGVRSRFGLDLIDIQHRDADGGGSTLNLRRRIAEGIRLGVQQGLQAGSGRATVELELLPNVSVETEVGVNSTGRVGIGLEWEY
jgi:translocation and assembly module TamB